MKYFVILVFASVAGWYVYNKEFTSTGAEKSVPQTIVPPTAFEKQTSDSAGQPRTFRCQESGRTIYSNKPCAGTAIAVKDHVTVVQHNAVTPNQQVVIAAQPQQFSPPIVQDAPAFSKCAPQHAYVEAAQKALTYSNPYDTQRKHQELRNAQAQLDDCEFASK